MHYDDYSLLNSFGFILGMHMRNYLAYNAMLRSCI